MTKRTNRRRESFSDQLRRVIEESELSRNQICKAAGLDPSHLHKFVHRTGRLTNDSIDRLAETLSARLIVEN